MTLLLLLLGCAPSPAPTSPQGPLPDWADWCRADPIEVSERVNTLVRTLDLDTAAGLLAGTSLLPGEDGLWRAPGHRDLPELTLVDGPRGVHKATGPATAFPVGSARGATWDPELERRVGTAIGAEARAKGAHVLLAPTINVLRHPRWGRAQETYGEDPVHLGQMGVAFVEGAQAHTIASVKHLAANSIEDTRFDVDVQVDEATLREIYLPHFRDVVQRAGVGSVMSAYNDLNGAPASENRHLLREILKEEWGFAGFVESDWVFGTESTVAPLEAGLDLEMPVGLFYGESLAEAVRSGAVDRSLIDEAVARLARTRWCFQIDTNPPSLDPDLVASPPHRALAQEVAEKAVVLLTNDGTIPLDTTASIALLGRLSDAENIGDHGSSDVEPPDVTTLLEGLEEAGAEVLYLPDWTPEDASALTTADVAVVAVGMSSGDEGEGLIGAGDRTGLRLRPTDLELVRAVAAIHPRTVVVLEGGSVIEVEDFVDEVSAILMAWYPGMEGGHALAAILRGDRAPSGRLPIVWPRTGADLPAFDNVSLSVTYDAWHGYRHLDRQGTPARFPFGWGLATTTFSVDTPTFTGEDDGRWVTVEASVSNTGSRQGTAVLQAYGRSDEPDRAVRELLGWGRAELAPGETTTVRVVLDTGALEVWDGEALVVPAGPTPIELGWFAGDVSAELVWER